jgi:hypothetical protein
MFPRYAAPEECDVVCCDDVGYVGVNAPGCGYFLALALESPLVFNVGFGEYPGFDRCIGGPD